MRIGSLLLLYLVCVMVSVTACAAPRGSIQGTVFARDGQPGSNLVIRAVRPEYHGILLRTGGDGAYHITNIPAGKWEIEFYDENGWQVGLETVTVSANETITLDFAIGEKPLPEGVVPSKIENAP